MASAARATTPRRYTTAEYLAMPVDDQRTELIDGEIVVSPSPNDSHQDWIHHLGHLLHCWTRHYSLGKVSFEVDMVLDEEKGLVFIPDLMFTTQANHGRRKRGRLFGPADLCIEILSRSDGRKRRERKFADYAKYGVPWYWTVQPKPDKPMLDEYELVEGEYRLRTQVVGDAWFEPALFPGLIFRLPPLLTGDHKDAVKGKAKKLV